MAKRLHTSRLDAFPLLLYYDQSAGLIEIERTNMHPPHTHTHTHTRAVMYTNAVIFCNERCIKMSYVPNKPYESENIDSEQHLHSRLYFTNNGLGCE